VNALWLALGAVAIALGILAGVCAGYIQEHRSAAPQRIHYCTSSSTDELCVRARARFEAAGAVAGEPSAAPVH